MAHGTNAQTATKANMNQLSDSVNKQVDGKYPMTEAKEALHFVQRHLVQLVRSAGSSSFAKSMMNSRSTKDAVEALKSDFARLITSPTFWIAAVLGSIAGLAGFVVLLLWVFCAPLLLRNSDFLTWALSEHREKYKGKVVWVTGGTTGIGFSICKHLTLRNVRGLIITGRFPERLEKAREELISFAASHGVSLANEDFLLLPIDLSKGLRPEDDTATREAWEQTVQQAIQWKGGVDILFNNAGEARIAASMSSEDEACRLSIGCLPPIETFAEVMDANRTSALAASTQDLRGCGSKGVLVTSVHPGYIATNLHQNITDPLVDATCDRSTSVQWKQHGLDVDVAASLILRAVSRDLEEAWMAVPVGLLQMYLGFYLPNFLYFFRRFSAKKECSITSEYRETVVSQLTKCSSKTK
ncbi:hypothetical protein Emed_003386 [Eimeria media]